jgi:hypothetical protein
MVVKMRAASSDLPLLCKEIQQCGKPPLDADFALPFLENRCIN